MADFGSAGTVTIRSDDNAVLVNVSAGQYLYYRLTVEGAVPTFTFVCTHRSRLSAHQFAGDPMQTYEWTLGQAAGDVTKQVTDAADDTYTVGMSFIGATKYTLFVELRNPDGSSAKTIEDADYASQSPNDWFPDGLRVFTH